LRRVPSAATVAVSETRPVGDQVATDEAGPRFVKLQIIPAHEGILGVIEASKHFGFPVRRMYFLTGVGREARRAGHAHRALRQCFICLRGAVTIDLEKNGHRSTFRLSDYETAMILPPGWWRDLYDFTDDALIAVLASDEYDETDYIRNYDEFRAWETASARASVPYLDLARYPEGLLYRFHCAIDGVLKSGRYIGGEAVERFEREFAAYCDVRHAVGTGNGLDALVIGLRAWSIGAGDEVILPANTFTGTAIAVSAVGATPVLVDAEPDTGLIDVEQAEAAVSPRTRAIIPVHLYGHPADMDPLRTIARRHGLFLFEDACQAHGARYKGKRCGSLGDAAAFSFYPTKNLGAFGDSGAFTCDDSSRAATARRLGNYGSNVRYRHDLIGMNSRLDPLHAALLSVKLDYLDAWNERRRALAGRYLDGLSDIDDLVLPAVRAWAEPIWHVFPVMVRGGRRDAVQEALAAEGIGTNIHYPIPVHLQPCYESLGQRHGAFPVSERRAVELLSLPLDALHSDQEIDRVVEAVRKVFR
jgi:dTDP-4-amino-4,6-dideoxygalactose transaminase